MSAWCSGCATCRAEAGESNLPGLGTLAYMRGSYGPTLLRMRDRLSSAELAGLRGLLSRAPGDPTLALLDAWACLGHVLSFYNERLINEAYLRTCTERRSAIELARLVGYAPRTGVAADVYLAFTLDDLDKEAECEVPVGTRTYSQPGPGETMQPFETVEPLRGRPRWSLMRARTRRPQEVTQEAGELYLSGTRTGLRPGDAILLEFDGRTRPVRQLRKVQHIELLEPEVPAAGFDPLAPPAGRTRVVLQPSSLARDAPRRGARPGRAAAATGASSSRGPRGIDQPILHQLLRAPTLSTDSTESLRLDPALVYQPESYALLQSLGVAYPALRDGLAGALKGSAPGGETGALRVYALRVKAAPHGHNAQLQPVFGKGDRENPVITVGYKEWLIDEVAAPPPAEGATPTIYNTGGRDMSTRPREQRLDTTGLNVLPLDAVYDQISVGSQVVVEYPVVKAAQGAILSERYTFAEVWDVATISRRAYNLPARVTRLTLSENWRDGTGEAELATIRDVTIYAAPERLELADEPWVEPVQGAEIVLDGFYDGLQPGRRLIVAGERADLEGVAGVQAAELVVVAGVTHRAVEPAQARARTKREQAAGGGGTGNSAPVVATGATYQTYLTLERPLAYAYTRATLTIYGNVAHATHGESVSELLGSGNAARALQVFALRKPPLTYVSAPTPTGVSSTLKVWVNDLRWHEADAPVDLGPDDRRYVTQTDDDGTTRLIFGAGARLPSGRDNVRASYRAGIGAAGNVKAGQIGILASRPNGVVAVTNPRPSTGGADPDQLEQIRRRAPIGLSALDRLVSVADYADFAHDFAGIAKAAARYFGDRPGEQLVHLTIAAEDDAPLSAESDMYRNLLRALQLQGDESAPVQIAFRAARLLAIGARVRLHPDHRWEVVRPRIAEALYRTFGFDRRELAQPAYASEAIETIQSVPGVAYVDLEVFGALTIGTPGQPPGPMGQGVLPEPRTPEAIATEARQLFARPAQTAADRRNMATVEAQPALRAGPDIHPAELVYLSPRVPATLLLELIEEDGR